MELFMIFFVPLLIINIVAFIYFGFEEELDEKGYFGLSSLDNLVLVMTIGGAVGALIAMIVFKHKPKDILYKITVPVGVGIQIGVLTYLFLFEAGIVK